MGYNYHYGWGKPFIGSVIFHVVVIVMLGFIIHYTPPVDFSAKDPIMVEIYSPGDGGGGGGGGGSGGGEANMEAVTGTSQAPLPQSLPEEYWESETVAPDSTVPPIYDEKAEKAEAAAPAKPSIPTKGEGSGYGTGQGTGIGSGTGSGVGSGSGSGYGSGHGSGTGSGSGSGSGDASGIVLLTPISPSYPAAAREAGAEGQVRVGMVVGVDGTVTSAWVISSSGRSDLDNAAVEAVYRARFVPAKRGGRAVESQAAIGVQFQLTNA